MPSLAATLPCSVKKSSRHRHCHSFPRLDSLIDDIPPLSIMTGTDFQRIGPLDHYARSLLANSLASSSFLRRLRRSILLAYGPRPPSRSPTARTGQPNSPSRQSSRLPT